MANATFMPKTDIGKIELLEHLAATLPKYQSVLEISNEDMGVLKRDTFNVRRAHTAHHQAQNYAHHWTAYKNQLFEGGSGDVTWPVAPVIDPNFPQNVAPGVNARLYSLVVRIKAHKNYTTAIGQDSHIIGPEILLDTSSWKPALSVQYNAGHPVVVWSKGQAGAIEIWVDRSDGNGFVFFTINTEPDTPDNTALPAPGTGVNWKYKAIYRLHDEQVGQWSDVLSILAGG